MKFIKMRYFKISRDAKALRNRSKYMLELIVAVAFIMLSWPRPVQSCSSSPGRYSLMDGPLWISIMDTDACNTQNCILKRLRNNMPYASVRSMKKAEYFKLRFDLTGQAYEGFYLQSNDLRCGIMCVGENRVSLQTFLWCSRLSQESSNGRSWRDELVAVEDDGLGAIDMMSFGEVVVESVGRPKDKFENTMDWLSESWAF